MKEPEIREILKQGNYISPEEIAKADDFVKNQGGSFLDYFFNKNLLTKNILGQAIAEHFHVSFVDLQQVKIEEPLLALIPELVARSRGVLVFGRDTTGIKVAMVNPEDLEIRHLLEKRFGEKVFPFFALESDLNDSLADYKPSLQEQFQTTLEKLNKPQLRTEDHEEITVEVLDMLFEYGHTNQASDIHIEPTEKEVLIRFRIDGVLHDVLTISQALFGMILSRIKILGKMRTDEHLAAQDGKLRFSSQNGSAEEYVDVRISIVPATHGENVVMRLLSARGRQFDLSNLGFSDTDFAKINKAIENPHGMILVTGPTGSGKTTTLYGVLKMLNNRDVNIATIEDPVEYDLDGVTQIQVNPKTNLTFAAGLRALVRQDPDIIMVGEIRDEDTASIAVNSALTGHLVLSTLHTNDAATTLPRLLDMNIEPFLVASTVKVALGQRLVRKICSQCRLSYSLTPEEQNLMNSFPRLREIFQSQGYVEDMTAVHLYRGHGCDLCNNTGYHGRVAIFEVLEMSDGIQALVLKNASSNEIMTLAKHEGMTTMFEDGVEKVFAGITTLDELMRAIRE